MEVMVGSIITVILQMHLRMEPTVTATESMATSTTQDKDRRHHTQITEDTVRFVIMMSMEILLKQMDQRPVL